MFKKILITTIAVAAILVIVLMLVRMKKTAVAPSEEQSQVAKDVPVAPLGSSPSLPEVSSEISKINNNSDPVNLRPSDYKLSVNNSKDPAEIERAYQKYVTQQPTRNSEWALVLTSSEQVVALEDFSKAVGLNMNPQLKELLMPYRYYLFSCNFEGKISHGIVLRVKLLPNYKGNLSKDESMFLKKWEDTMLRDTRSIVFPTVAFSEDQLNQQLAFKKGKYNYAEVNLPNNEKSSLNYTLLDDYLVITDSMACMDVTADQLIAPAP